MTVDGQVGTTFAHGETLIGPPRGAIPCILVRFPEMSFFTRMRREARVGRARPTTHDARDADRAPDPELRDHRVAHAAARRGLQCPLGRDRRREVDHRRRARPAAGRARERRPRPHRRRTRERRRRVRRRRQRARSPRCSTSGASRPRTRWSCSSAKWPRRASRAWINGVTVTAAVLAEVGRTAREPARPARGADAARRRCAARHARRVRRCDRRGARACVMRTRELASVRRDDRRPRQRGAPRPRSAPTTCGTSCGRSRRRSWSTARTSASTRRRGA